MFLRRSGIGDFYQQMNRLQNEMNVLFGRPGPSAGIGASGPPVNVWEDEHTIFVEADVPGVDPERIDVSITDGNCLVIQGERPAPDVANGVWHRHERGTGNFVREFSLPIMVDAGRVLATHEDGVLNLTLPKAYAAKPRKIAVKSA